MLKKQKDIKHPLFDKVLNGYEKLLRFCLRRKAVPLALAIALLGVSVWRVATMGIVMIPDMSSNQLTITVNVPDDTAKEDAFATADSVMDAVMTVDGVDTVGAMSGGSNNMVAMAAAMPPPTTPRLPITSCWATRHPRPRSWSRRSTAKQQI